MIHFIDKADAITRMPPAQKIEYYRERMQDKSAGYGKKYHKSRVAYYQRRITKVEKYARLKAEMIELTQQGMNASQIHRHFLQRGDTIHYTTIIRYRRIIIPVQPRYTALHQEALILARTKNATQIYKYFRKRGETVSLPSLWSWLRTAGLQHKSGYGKSQRYYARLKSEAIELAKAGLTATMIHGYFQKEGKVVTCATVQRWLCDVKTPITKYIRKYSIDGRTLKEEVIELGKQGMTARDIYEYFNASDNPLQDTVALETIHRWLTKAGIPKERIVKVYGGVYIKDVY